MSIEEEASLEYLTPWSYCNVSYCITVTVYVVQGTCDAERAVKVAQMVYVITSYQLHILKRNNYI